MKQSKRENMEDVLHQLGFPHNKGHAVVGDSRSRVAGPNPARASIVKMLLDSLSDKLEPIGLRLSEARIGWDTEKSPAQVYAKLQQLGLLNQTRHVDALPPANLPIIE